jgi:hypothetical protein
MRRRLGPILYARPGDETQWRFEVGVLAEGTGGAPPTLAFTPADGVRIEPLAVRRVDDRRSWLAWPVSVARGDAGRTLAYTIDGLAPGLVSVEGVVVPAAGEMPRIVFFSCNGVQDPKLWTKLDDPERLWNVVLDRHAKAPREDGSGGPYHLLVGGGDQIYCDEIWHLGDLAPLRTWDARCKKVVSAALAERIARWYLDTYAERWGDRSRFARVLARVPAAFTWDDHDVFDGWGSYDDALQASALFRAIYGGARRAFALFQLGGLDPSPGVQAPGGLVRRTRGDHFLQVLRPHPALGLLLLDLRSDRTAERVMAEAQWDDLAAALRELRDVAHLLVVSSIPLVYLNFRLGEKALARVPGRQDLEDDLRDQWESAAHQGERTRLLMTLLAYRRQTGARVTVLSGDVHVGCRGRIVSRRPEHLRSGERESILHQITSSGVVYPPPSWLEIAAMRWLGDEGPLDVLSLSQVETELLPISADQFLLRETNWLSIEPDRPGDPRRRLWIRWITADGPVEPPLVVHARRDGD